mgnify:CR=1 FL=1
MLLATVAVMLGWHAEQMLAIDIVAGVLLARRGHGDTAAFPGWAGKVALAQGLEFVSPERL